MEMIYRLDDISAPAGMIIQAAGNPGVIAFHGQMGAGKTTLIKEICRLLGSQDNVSSPTFSIINEYLLPGNQPVYHIDLYRLKDDREAVSAGLLESLDSGHYCFIEWPDLVKDLLPADSLHCYISALSTDERKLEINM